MARHTSVLLVRREIAYFNITVLSYFYILRGQPYVHILLLSNCTEASLQFFTSSILTVQRSTSNPLYFFLPNCTEVSLYYLIPSLF